MIDITIPGSGQIQIDHLLCSVTVTTAPDVMLFNGIQKYFDGLSRKLILQLEKPLRLTATMRS